MESSRGKGRALRSVLFFLALAGIMAWAAMMAIGKPAWGILLTDYLYFAGITQGALAIAVILRITSARWSAHFYRPASALALSFFPVGLVMMAAVFIFKNQIFYWYEGVTENPWYNPAFFVIRNLLPFLAFYLLARKLLGTSTLAAASAGSHGPAHADTHVETHSLDAHLEEGYGHGHPIEKSSSVNGELLISGFFLLIAFAFYQTIMSWDFGMLLNKHFADTAYSVIFGVSSVVGGIALLILVMFVNRRFQGNTAFGLEQIQNLAKIMLGLIMLWFYIWYTQFFSIWFVNLPEETEPVYLRLFHGYGAVFAVSIFLAVALPFFTLIFKKVRESETAVAFLASSVLVGLWLDRYLMAVPSLVEDKKIAETVVAHPVNILFTVGILATVLIFFTRILTANSRIMPRTSEELIGDPVIADVTGWQ